MKSKVKKLRLNPNSIKREDQLNAGLFDGRYRQRIVVDKKKKIKIKIKIKIKRKRKRKRKKKR